MLYWCGNVVIDRRSDQLGKVLVCFHAVTIQHRGRATSSIAHDTHGHRLGQNKAQTGFEGSQEALHALKVSLQRLLWHKNKISPIRVCVLGGGCQDVGRRHRVHVCRRHAVP